MTDSTATARILRPLLVVTFGLLLAAARPAGGEEPILRVAVVGASASAGFGVIEAVRNEDGEVRQEGISLGDTLLAATPDTGLVVLDLASGGFFMRPRAYGASSLQRAIDWKPDLVLGIDFLFWYVYGNAGFDPDPEVGRSKRMAGLEAGLEALDGVKGPLVIGEIPDMSPAIGGMLSKRQVPSPEVIEAANDRIRDWVSDRPNVVLVPLHGLIEQLGRGEPFTIGPHPWNREGAETLLLPDRLHPNLLGLVALLQSTWTTAGAHPEFGARLPEARLERSELVDRIRGTGGATSAPEEDATSAAP